jgi:hypothetical protein
MFWLGSVLSARIGAQMRPLALLVWSLLLIDRDELKWISIMYQERNYMRAALSVLLAVVFLVLSFSPSVTFRQILSAAR